jgi:hypothetical protein
MKTTRKKLMKEIYDVANSKTSYQYIAFWKDHGWHSECGYNVHTDYTGPREKNGTVFASLMFRNDKTTMQHVNAELQCWVDGVRINKK